MVALSVPAAATLIAKTIACDPAAFAQSGTARNTGSAPARRRIDEIARLEFRPNSTGLDQRATRRQAIEHSGQKNTIAATANSIRPRWTGGSGQSRADASRVMSGQPASAPESAERGGAFPIFGISGICMARHISKCRPPAIAAVSDWFGGANG